MSSIKSTSKAVKSVNPCESLIQTFYEIMKAHGGEINVETVGEEGSEFQVVLTVNLSK